MDILVAAAGSSKRFSLEKSKLLQPICGETPVIAQVLTHLRGSKIPGQIVLAVKYQADEIMRAAGLGVKFVTQQDYGGLKGPAIALRSFLDAGVFSGTHVMVMFGDLPLVSAKDLADFYADVESYDAALMTVEIERDEFMWIHYDGFGRPARVNKTQSTIGDVGCYYFSYEWLQANIDKLEPGPNGEYYISGLVEVAYDMGTPFHEHRIRDWQHALGVNTKEDLEFAKRILCPIGG